MKKIFIIANDSKIYKFLILIRKQKNKAFKKSIIWFSFENKKFILKKKFDLLKKKFEKKNWLGFLGSKKLCLKFKNRLTIKIKITLKKEDLKMKMKNL